MKELLKNIIEEINEFDEFDEETDLLGDGILDSLSLMIFIEKVEKALSIEIPEKEVTLENFYSINSIVEMLDKIDKE